MSGCLTNAHIQDKESLKMDVSDPPDCQLHRLPNYSRLFSLTEIKVEVVQLLSAGKGQPSL